MLDMFFKQFDIDNSFPGHLQLGLYYVVNNVCMITVADGPVRGVC